MCSNPSTRKLTIRPDFDMDVYLHPPSMHHLHRRTRKISTSSIDSNADDNGSPVRRFSFSNIFAYFRQNSTSSNEFPATLASINGTTNKSLKAESNTVKDETAVKEKEIHQQMLPNRFFKEDDEY